MTVVRNLEMALWLYNTGCPCAAEDFVKAALASLKHELSKPTATAHTATVSQFKAEGYEEIPWGR